MAFYRIALDSHLTSLRPAPSWRWSHDLHLKVALAQSFLRRATSMTRLARFSFSNLELSSQTHRACFSNHSQHFLKLYGLYFLFSRAGLFKTFLGLFKTFMATFSCSRSPSRADDHLNPRRTSPWIETIHPEQKYKTSHESGPYAPCMPDCLNLSHVSAMFPGTASRFLFSGRNENRKQQQ